ncbi:MAG: ChaN family lipoprotein [Chitinophagaceae bacterium]
MRFLSVALLAFLFGINTAKAQYRPEMPQPPFKIIQTATGNYITLTELADKLKRSEVVIWGEEHDDTIGHILELKLLKMLRERFEGSLHLSLEMFETDCQVLLEDYLGGFISREKFLKDSRPWSNYEDYSPMVEFCKDQHIPITAANSPRRYNSLMSQRGPKSLDSLSSGAKKLIARLPVYVPSKGRYFKKFIGIMGGEENIHSPNMFASQCLWDATMAKSIQSTVDKNKKEGMVMHVCGRFHSDEYLGTVSQLYRLDKDIKVSTISCFPSGDFEKPDFAACEALADYVILVKKDELTE